MVSGSEIVESRGRGDEIRSAVAESLENELAKKKQVALKPSKTLTPSKPKTVEP